MLNDDSKGGNSFCNRETHQGAKSQTAPCFRMGNPGVLKPLGAQRSGHVGRGDRTSTGCDLQAWDGVSTTAQEHQQDPEPLGGKQPGMHDRFAGYCWHASILFPTWHRAYILIMEQVTP
jgi:hypothetical protein